MIKIKGWDQNSLIQRVFAYNIKYDLDSAEGDRDKLAEMKEHRLGDLTLYLPNVLSGRFKDPKVDSWIS